MIRRLGFIFVIVMSTWSAVDAQTGGQFWVKAFEDLNGNGVRDQGEPVLTRGIGVNLLNADGVVVASALLDSSPNATQGLVGFQFLPPGSYAIVVTSAEYAATTPQTINTTITEGALPTVVEFGGQPIAPALPAAPTPAADNPLAPVMAQLNQFDLVQITAAGVSSLLAMCGTAIIGIILYLILALRGRTREVEEIKMSTGAMRPVKVTETGEYRRK
jgi:hypothetical protein